MVAAPTTPTPDPRSSALAWGRHQDRRRWTVGASTKLTKAMPPPPPRHVAHALSPATRPRWVRDFAEAYLVARAERSGVTAVASFDRSIDRIGSTTRVEPARRRAKRVARSLRLD